MRTQMHAGAGLKLSLILGLAALLRFWGLGVKQLWLDEILQLLHSRPDTLRGILEGVAQDRGGAPMDYLVQHLFISNVSGAIEWTARLHAALFGVLAVYLIYVVCQILFENQRWSLLSALLLCFYPFHHHYSQEGRPYSLFMLLTLALFFILFRSLKNSGRFVWVCFAAVSVLSFYTNAYTAIVLFVQLLILVYHQLIKHETWPSALRRIAVFIFCSLVAAVAYIPWLRYSYFNAKGNAPPGNSFRLFAEMVKGLGDGSYPLAFALILCAVAGIYHLRKTQRSFEAGALLIWMIAPFPIVLAVLNLRNYFFSTRQLVFIVPALMMLAAIGADYMKRKIGSRYFSPAVILILISVVVIALHYPDRRDDQRSAGRYLKDNVQSGDAVIAPGISYTLSFYFPDINKYSAENRPIESLLNAGDVSRIIYVDSRFNYSRAGIDDLFSAVPKPEETRFRGITIYSFSKPRWPAAAASEAD
ncbi:MAG: glycosyltransferase family 39 protein [Acidobacteria bacterium]|nr:glycosyltransferase family 39 protein [Acidobacteriota bacterium]